MEVANICLISRHYIDYTVVMLTSLCVNNPVSVHAYLLHGELTEEHFQYMRECLKEYDIVLIPVPVGPGIFHDRFPRDEKWSVEAYYRLLLLDYLPAGVERILYLDVDLIVNRSLEEYYTVDFQGTEIITCVDACGKCGDDFTEKQRQMFEPMLELGFQYFNSGVMLLNIAQMRGKYNFEFYLRAIEEWDYAMFAPDQDILNYVHWQRIGYIDPYAYDLFANIAHREHISYETVKENAYIVHFVGAKPWNTTDFHFDIQKLWWDYAALTPCYQKLVSAFMKDSFENPALEEKIKNLFQGYQNAVSQLEQMKEINSKLMDVLKKLK